MTKAGQDTGLLSTSQSNKRKRRRGQRPEEALTDIIYRVLAMKSASGMTALDAIILHLTAKSLKNDERAKRVLLKYHQRSIVFREPKITVIGELLDDLSEVRNG